MTASITLAAFSVQTSGRNCPVASANPATSPLGSEAAVLATAYAVPDVPAEITASPVRSPTPIAAAMLSPVPGATTSERNVPTCSYGPTTAGSTLLQSRSRSINASTSSAYVPVVGDQ